MAWVWLGVAILAEVIGTIALRGVAGRLTASAIGLVLAAYLVSFACMGAALRQLNVGVVYAIWSAVGTTLVVAAGAILFKEHVNVQAVAGMAIIIVGVAVLVTAGGLKHA